MRGTYIHGKNIRGTPKNCENCESLAQGIFPHLQYTIISALNNGISVVNKQYYKLLLRSFEGIYISV